MDKHAKRSQKGTQRSPERAEMEEFCLPRAEAGGMREASKGYLGSKSAYKADWASAVGRTS